MIENGDVIGISKLTAANPRLLTKPIVNDRGENLKALSFAVSSGQELICSNLISLGANVNESDRYQYTPLHFAVMAQQTNIVILLIKHGADVNRRDFEGLTPMDLAIKMNSPNSIVKLLSEAKSVSTNK
jgi:ankyrin repeat protein